MLGDGNHAELRPPASHHQTINQSPDNSSPEQDLHKLPPRGLGRLQDGDRSCVQVSRGAAYKGERLFREIVNKVAKHHIPSGRRPRSTPGLPPEAAKLTSQRDALRTNNPTSPDLPLLNNKIEMILRKSQTARWLEYLQTFDPKTKPEKLWRTIRTIDGKTRDPPNPSIRFDGRTYTRPKDQARLFNKHLTAQSNTKAQKRTESSNAN